MAISHVFSNTIPDGTNTNIVRPSDWNSAHNQYYTLSGNTLGVSTVSGTNVVFEGAGNVSLSGTGQTIVLYATGGGVGGGVALSAGTQSVSSGTVSFANSNGITFGMSGSNQITASYTVPTQSVQTQASGNIAGSGFSSTTTTGTAIVGTNDSNGLNLGVPAYLTTQSVQTQASGNIARTGFSSTTTTGTAVVGTLNTGGLSLGVPAYLTTQSVQTQASGNIVGSGFTGANATGTLNSNGLSLSVAAPGAANYSIGVSNLGNTAGSTGITGTRIVFVGTNNISLSQSTDANGATISINQTGGGGGPTAYVASLNGSTGSISLNVGSSLSSSTNGSSITFGLASNITTALQSANANYLTSQSNQAFSASGGSSTFQTLNFANSNGITFSNSGGSVVASYTVPTVPTAYVSSVNGSSGQISLNVGSSLSSSTNGSSITFGLASNITTALQSANANYLTSQSNQAFSASGGSSTFQTLNFANSNGVTFSNSGGSVVASYTVPTVPTAYVSSVNGSSGAISLNVGSSLSASTNGSSITFGLASNITTALQSTGNYLTTARASNDAVGLNTAATNVTWTVNSSGISLNAAGYAGTNTSANNASLTLNSNGLTISVAAPGGGGAGNFNLSGATSGNTTASGSTINLSGINVTLSGTNGSQIAISAPATSSLSAGNNFSISTNGSTIILSARAAALGAGTQTALSGTVNFANSNGITFGMSGSSQITASYTVPLTTGFAGTGFTSTTVTGTAVQGTLSTNGLSLAVPAYLTAAAGGNFSGGVSNLGNTDGSTGITGTRIVFVGTNNISLSQSTDANGATISINQTGGGGGGIAAAAGTQTATSGTVNFANSNGVTFGMSGSNQITASIATSLTNINVSAGTTSNNLSNIVFSNGNGVTFGLNGSTVTASVAPAGGVIESGYSPHGDYPLVVGQIGQGTLALDPDIFPDLTMNQIAIPINFTNASNSTGSFTVSNWVGLYSRNVSSISLAHSTSFSQGITFSGSSNSSVYQGWRNITYPWSTSISGGRYWIAQIMRTTTGGANCSFSQYLASQINTNFLGVFGVATNATAQLTLGQGFYSASTTALPGSIAFTEIRGTNSLAQRFPMVAFGYNTV